MASRIQGITVEIGGDTTKLSKALESVNKSIKGTQSGLKDVNKLLKLDPSNTELVVQKQKMLKDAIEATKEKLATLKTAAQQANEQLANGEITQQQYDALQREIVETEQNTSCLKKFEDVEYVELLLNSVDRCVAIRPCEKGNPNAIHWGRLKEGRWCASTLGCRGLAKTLFDIMEWEEGLKYRFRGQFVEQGDNKLMLFELDEPEMIKIEEIVLPSKEEEAEGKTVKQMIYIFPPEWAGTFEQPITSIAQVGILQQEHYAGNWDVLRPAAEIKEMNTFTADGLNALLHEAEEIMEGWTDTNE